MPRVGDAAELLEDHEVGWICEPGEASMAHFLLAALRDPVAREEASRRALGLATGPLGWPVLAQRLETAYRTVLGTEPEREPTAAATASSMIHENIEPR